MGRTYVFPQSSWREILVICAIWTALGCLFSWLVLGGVYWFIPGVFFLASLGFLLANNITLCLQDDALHIISPLRTKRIPYARFVPFLAEAKFSPRGTWLYYQGSFRKKAFFLRGQIIEAARGYVGTADVGRRRIYEEFLCRCGHKPERDEAKRARAKSPEANPRELLELAKDFPEEILGNSALPLFSLEDPKLYQDLILTAKKSFIEEWFCYATEQQRWLLICDFLQGSPQTKIPRCYDLLQLFRHHALGTVSRNRLTGSLSEFDYLRNKGIPKEFLGPLFFLLDDPADSLRFLLPNRVQELTVYQEVITRLEAKIREQRRE